MAGVFPGSQRSYRARSLEYTRTAFGIASTDTSKNLLKQSLRLTPFIFRFFIFCDRHFSLSFYTLYGSTFQEHYTGTLVNAQWRASIWAQKECDQNDVLLVFHSPVRISFFMLLFFALLHVSPRSISWFCVTVRSIIVVSVKNSFDIDLALPFRYWAPHENVIRRRSSTTAFQRGQALSVHSMHLCCPPSGIPVSVSASPEAFWCICFNLVGPIKHRRYSISCFSFPSRWVEHSSVVVVKP